MVNYVGQCVSLHAMQDMSMCIFSSYLRIFTKPGLDWNVDWTMDSLAIILSSGVERVHGSMQLGKHYSNNTTVNS